MKASYMFNRALLPPTGSDQLGSFATDDGNLSQTILTGWNLAPIQNTTFYKARCLFTIRSRPCPPLPNKLNYRIKAWWRKTPGFHGLHEGEVGI